MSVQAKPTEVAERPPSVTVTIDGIAVEVPKGTLVIRAAEMIGIAIPRFCDHPLLDPVGACRQCMVEVPDMGNGRGMPKPQASCTLECADGMKVATQRTSEKAEKAQRGMIELLLVNHPLDCPICDKGGECPLQNQAMSTGNGESRFDGLKRTYPKPVNVSAQILLDRERCVLCARCTRFSEQISGDPFIALVERGALQQIGRYETEPYDSYFSGNVVQICPVGALTSAAYRFQSRPFDLVSTPVTCEHCASGCQLRTDHRHFQVKRRLAGDLPEVNEEWNCDRGRFAFVSGRGSDRLTYPLIRENGELRPASWPEAIDAAVAGLRRIGTSAGVVTGGRLTLEAAYAYSKFARTVLGTNNVDFRARPHTSEEAEFLAALVAGRRLGEGVTYADLETAAKVICVAFEPEDESPIVFLRLRKAARKKKLAIQVVSPYRSRGTEKMLAEHVPAIGAEAISGLTADAGTIILVGERAAQTQGMLSAVAELAARTGARLAWVPRRAGDRGAIEAGCLPNLLPGGRPVADNAARVDVAASWGVDRLPAGEGLDADSQFAAASDGQLKGLIVAGVEPADFASRDAVLAGLEAAEFVLSLETRASEVTERADVVLPVALLETHAGTFLNWEHRPGPVEAVVKSRHTPMTDLRILAALADAVGTPLGIRTVASAQAEIAELGVWEGPRPATPVLPTAPRGGEVTLTSWRQLIDGSRANDGEPALLETARPVVARVSPATAERLGLGAELRLSSATGSHDFAVVTDPSMVDDAVWIPGNFFDGSLGTLGVVPGEAVTVVPASELVSAGGNA
ncbi:NADH-quinone oxidoreductase subunit G [Propionicicella superfundia]|uniref:NADH-quinone oxidoreductase subunit G n=1 Tax=Propionicicella superfundia TaxID=348582 RepID=UPI000403A83D|nr:NADH-quinone oxidoreductase subunit G [Propionicicella superfundia]